MEERERLGMPGLPAPRRSVQGSAGRGSRKQLPGGAGTVSPQGRPVSWPPAPRGQPAPGAARSPGQTQDPHPPLSAGTSPAGRRVERPSKAVGVLECKEELLGRRGGGGDADNSGLAPTGLKGPSGHAVEVTALQAGLTPGLLRVCPRGMGRPLQQQTWPQPPSHPVSW